MRRRRTRRWPTLGGWRAGWSDWRLTACSAWWWAFCEEEVRAVSFVRTKHSRLILRASVGQCNMSMVKMVAGELAQIQVWQD
ncbi:unnamed protein product [Ectocarpus fasciculatus]